jgi:hypothetical protein
MKNHLTERLKSKKSSIPGWTLTLLVQELRRRGTFLKAYYEEHKEEMQVSFDTFGLVTRGWGRHPRVEARLKRDGLLDLIVWKNGKKREARQ